MRPEEQFFSLTPDRVLEAVELCGIPVTGLCYTLNSLENRVYEIEREDRSRVVAKFYRPGRWSREAILDEHRFLQDLIEAEIPVCPALPFPDGETLHTVPGTAIHCAVFPREGGRAPEELTDEQLRRLGTLLARIHNVGASAPAPHRVTLTPESYGLRSLDSLDPVLPMDLAPRFRAVVQALVEGFTPMWEGIEMHRIHGDCHLGNLLWGSRGPFFLDFDDMLIGPPMQDVWLLVSGREPCDALQRDVLLEGYGSFRTFDRASLRLLEPLRTLRYLHYAAWVTRRWEDPSFPKAFPHYGTHRYWSELLKDLEDQRKLILGSGGASVPVAGAGPSAPARSRVTVRQVAADQDNFQRVVMIRSEAFVETLELPEGVILDGRDREAVHFLAEDERGRAVGTLRLLEHQGPDPVRLTLLAVMPGQERQGVGKALVIEAMDHARRVGASGLVVDTRVEAIPFFATLGFVAMGRPYSADGTMLRKLVIEWG